MSRVRRRKFLKTQGRDHPRVGPNTAAGRGQAHRARLARSRRAAIENFNHYKRRGRRIYPPTGQEHMVLLAFVSADIAKAQVDNTVKVPEEAAHLQTARTTPSESEPEHDREPGKPRSSQFCRRD